MSFQTGAVLVKDKNLLLSMLVYVVQKMAQIRSHKSDNRGKHKVAK